MEALLTQQGIWGPLEGPKPTDVAKGTWEKINAKARETMLLSLSDEVLSTVAGAQTALALWLQLESLYGSKSLTKELNSKASGSDRSTQAEVLAGLRATGKCKNRDVCRNCKAVGHWKRNCPMLKANVRANTVATDAANVARVGEPGESSNKAAAHKFSRGSQGNSSRKISGSLFHAHAKSERNCSLHQNKETPRSKMKGGRVRRSRTESRKPSPTDVCFRCKEQGHWKKECQMSVKVTRGVLDSKKHKNVAFRMAKSKEFEQSGVRNSVMESVGDCVNQSDVWVFDTQCLSHMCSYREWFMTYEAGDFGNVVTRSGATCKIVGTGSIQVKMHDGIIRTFVDVCYVPESKQNVISLGILDSRGCKISCRGGVLHVSKGSLVIMKGSLKDDLGYVLLGKAVVGSGY